MWQNKQKLKSVHIDCQSHLIVNLSRFDCQSQLILIANLSQLSCLDALLMFWDFGVQQTKVFFKWTLSLHIMFCQQQQFTSTSAKLQKMKEVELVEGKQQERLL